MGRDIPVGDYVYICRFVWVSVLFMCNVVSKVMANPLILCTTIEFYNVDLSGLGMAKDKAICGRSHVRKRRRVLRT